MPARRGARSGRGQALVEFALMLPVFLLITLGVVDMTRVFTANISLTNAVREAAIFAGYGDGYSRWCSSAGAIACPAGSLGHDSPNPNNIAFRIEGEANGLSLDRIVLDTPVCALADGSLVNCDPLNLDIATVRIRASYTVPVLTPVLIAVLGNNVAMSAATTASVIR